KLIGHASSKVILKEGKTLPEQVAVRLPAHTRLKGWREHLILGELIGDKDRWSGNQNDECHPRQQGSVVGKERLRRCGAFQQVDEIGDELGERYFAQCGKQVKDENESENWPNRPHEMPVEGPKPLGWTRDLALKRVNT